MCILFILFDTDRTAVPFAVAIKNARIFDIEGYKPRVIVIRQMLLSRTWKKRIHKKVRLVCPFSAKNRRKFLPRVARWVRWVIGGTRPHNI